MVSSRRTSSRSVSCNHERNIATRLLEGVLLVTDVLLDPLGEVGDVAGELGGDVLGQLGEQGQPRAHHRGAAALGKSRFRVHGPVRQPAQAAAGHHVDRSGEQAFLPRRERYLRHAQCLLSVDRA